ncbi:MAG TPA: hypothetical protein VF867_01195 [Arthrobacter sp.]
MAEDKVNEERAGVRPERGKSWDSVVIDEETLPSHPDALRGLMDAESVSRFLGYPRGTIRSWGFRRKDGTSKGGAPSKFPEPLERKLGNVVLWDEADIVAFRKRRATETKMKKKA